MEKMFEFALRNKVRFPYKGMISVEDLYDLSARELDGVFKTLNAQVKKSQEESLLATKTKEDETLSVQIEIVKYIFNTKLAEAEAAKQSRELKEKKQMLLGLIAEKENEELKNKSADELKAMLESLN
jgi:hypothetical protein